MQFMRCTGMDENPDDVKIVTYFRGVFNVIFA